MLEDGRNDFYFFYKFLCLYVQMSLRDSLQGLRCTLFHCNLIISLEILKLVVGNVFNLSMFSQPQ